MKPSILIATSNGMLNKKIYELLHQTKCYKFIKGCTKQDNVEDILFQFKPHLAILSADYPTGSGISIAGRLKRAGVQTKIALLAENEDVTLMRLALQYGVKGYFKYVHDGQIFECLNALNKNEFYVETELYHAHYFSRVS